MGSPQYKRYAAQLQLLAADVARGAWRPIQQDVHAALNGQAAEQVRALVPLLARRQDGAFFTSGRLRDQFAHVADLGRDPVGTTYWDPACGAGDLLLAASEALPLGRTIRETLVRWGKRLCGTDLQASFVEVAQLRLFIAAAARHRQLGDFRTVSLDVGLSKLSKISPGDGLARLANTSEFRGHLLLNPPFGMMEVERTCKWATGLTSQAGVFYLTAATALSASRQVTAVLPDVLRSGSRYRAWRNAVDSILDIEELRSYGQFDPHTDVDVFTIRGRRRHPGHSAPIRSHWWPELASSNQVGHIFDVRVGPVVDNRDPHEGSEAPYLTAKGMPAAGEMGIPVRRRRYAGRLLEPPFVAMRRTSRPGQGVGGGLRSGGVVVVGDEPVAVDNHVITAKPIKGGTDTCFELLRVLQSPEVAAWLDERIRCRHITVGVIRSLPWPTPIP